jgi:hypothetical protein
MQLLADSDDVAARLDEVKMAVAALDVACCFAAMGHLRAALDFQAAGHSACWDNGFNTLCLELIEE